MKASEFQQKRLVVNALSYKKNNSGIGVMLRELCGAYGQVATRPCQIVMSKDSPDFPVGEKTELTHIPWNYRNGLHRMFFQTFGLGKAYCRGAILLTTDSKCPLSLPKSCTLLPLVTDLAVYRMPGVYRFSRVFLWRLQYCYVRRRADHFLAISEFTKSEMVKLWKIPAERIDIVPCACSGDLYREEDPQRLQVVQERYNLPEQFVLFVGNFNPRKNLERLIKAFDNAKEKSEFSHHLVIAGERGWKFDRQKTLQGCKHPKDIHFIGFVPDEDMAVLYSAASLFVFPSLYEGFGIPVLEAQICGVPVLTSNCSSLPEIGGNGAYYVDPYSEEEIAEGIREILAKPKLAKMLVRLGKENVKRFSWKESARCLEKIIEKEVGA